MTKTLAELWHSGQLPIRDGLYTHSGVVYLLQRNDTTPAGIEILDTSDIDSILSADPDWLTSVDVTREMEIEAAAGRLLAGEGSHGSEGFFARVDKNNNPLWVIYLEESNPFVDISSSENEATFHSSSGISITVDINHPESGVPWRSR